MEWEEIISFLQISSSICIFGENVSSKSRSSLRCVYTMPCGRMQHTAALPRGKSRQYDRTHMKKEFFADLLQVAKTVERDRRTWSDFFLKLADTILKPLLIICRAASFDGTDNLPIKFLDGAASNSMPQPSRCNVHIYLWHGATFAAQPCRCVLRSIVWTYL